MTVRGPELQFQALLSSSRFRHYAVEAVRNLTGAIINSKRMDIMSIRDDLADDLNVCTNTSDLTKLLISRQIDGSSYIRQQALLLRYLQITNVNNDHLDFETTP